MGWDRRGRGEDEGKYIGIERRVRGEKGMRKE